MEVRAGERITGKSKDDIVGQVVKVKVVKNKVGNPFKTTTFELIYNEGVNRVAEVVEIMTLIGNLVKSGAYLKLNDEDGEILFKDGQKLSFYKKDWITYLEERPALYAHFVDCISTGIPMDLNFIKNTDFVELNEELAEETV